MRTRLAATALASLFAISLLTAGCGKSVEGETKRWNANKLELEKFAGKYTGLKTAIDRHVADVQKEFDAAQQVADEDAKTKAMSVANQRIDQVLTPFRQLDTLLLDLEVLKRDPRILELPAGQVNPAIKLADGGVEKAKALLDGTGVDTSGALVGRIEEALRTVKLGAAELVTLKEQLDGAAKAAADKAAADKAAADKAAADKAAADKPAADKPAADKPAADKPADPPPAPPAGEGEGK